MARIPNLLVARSVGLERLSAVDATSLRFPSISLSGESFGVYRGLRQFHQAKGFDLDRLDVARHLGHPLYQIFTETEPPFAHGEFCISEDRFNPRNNKQ
jgi:hypothetical protein